MNLKLILVSWWTPRSVLLRELDRVAELTTGALDDLLAEHATSARLFSMQKRPFCKRFEDRRASMAEAHNKRVSALIETVGAEKAVVVGRESMFKVGVQLGQEARRRLGVGTGMKDLVRAARIMYKVLGIEFKIEWNTLGGATLRVSHCSLADSYSPEACMILSAADEGVVRGLNPGFSMRFAERITSGSPVCVACIDRVIAEEERR